MRTKLITIGALALAAAGLPLAAAHADPATPSECPGVVAVPEGYLLTQDTSCSLFEWAEDGKTFDLGGHTLTGRVFAAGADQTLRNGTLVTDNDYWAIATGFTVSDVTVEPPVPGGCLDFCIEAGDVTVEDSTFRNIGGIALSFFFGPDGGTIRNTRFIDNHIAVSIQASSELRIEHSRFVGNDVGVNLWPEDGFGVGANTIRANQFQGNEYGVVMTGDRILDQGVRPLSDNVIERNTFRDNGRSGLAIDVHCEDVPSSCAFPDGNLVERNRFRRNGYLTPAVLANNDGVTARGSYAGGAPDPIDHPAALVGFTLTANRADRNADLGFDVAGVTDGGGNRAKRNTNPAQCVGVDCGAHPLLRAPGSGTSAEARAVNGPPLEQLRHAGR